MDKRVLVLAGAAAAAMGVVGISAADTSSPGDSRPVPQKTVKSAKATPAKHGPASVPASQQEQGVDAAAYWTRERMKEAQPMEKTVRATARATKPASSGRGTLEVVPARAAPARPAVKPKRSRSGPATGPVSHSTTGNAAEYWTQDKMDDAQPKDNTVPVGSGGDASPSSDPPVIVVPPPPP